MLEVTKERLEAVVRDFRRAIAEPTKWCMSGRCDDTNWGGKDRLHSRQEDCPEFREGELRGYVERAEKWMATMDEAGDR